MKKIVACLIFLIVLLGCSSDIEGKIVNTIKDQCQDQSHCVISIAELTDFSWDKMYVFKYNATIEEMERVLGVPIANYSEFHRKIVFTLNGKIVHYEEYSVNIESLEDDDIVFDIPDALNYSMYTLNEAVFNVAEKSNGDISYYELYRKLK